MGNWTRRGAPLAAERVVPWLVLSIVWPPSVSSECSCEWLEWRAGLSARRDPGCEGESSWTKIGGGAADEDDAEWPCEAAAPGAEGRAPSVGE